MSYSRESDIRVKSYDHSNFSSASVVTFRASRWVMYANQTSLWKCMIIWISRVLPLCNYERLDILCPKFGHPCEKLWPFEFLESFRCAISSISIYYIPNSNIRAKSYEHSNFSRASVVQFQASRWVMYANRTSVWKVMTIQISWVLPLYNFERLDILCPSIQTSVWKVMTIRITRELPMFNFKHLDELCPRIGHLCEKLWPFKYLECFRCAISSVSMSYVRESDIFAKRYDHLNFSSASIVQLRASRYIMSQNRTSVWKFMTIRISRVLPLCNFKRLDELCPKFGHPCETLWPFEFL